MDWSRDWSKFPHLQFFKRIDNRAHLLVRNRVVNPEQSAQDLERYKRRRQPHLLNHTGQSCPLKSETSVPLNAEGCTHACFKLGFTCVWIWEVLHSELESLLVATLRNDDVSLAIVCSRFGINSRKFLDQMRFGCSFLNPSATP